MEEVRKINKRGQVVCSIEFNGRVYKRYPNGKHPNYYYWKFGHGNKQSEMLHHAVYKFYHGEIPNGKIIHHIDHNPLNNSIENLEAVSRSEHNRLHPEKIDNIVRMGLNTKGAYTKSNWNQRRIKQLPDYRAKRECASNVADDSQQQMFISDFAQRNAITNGSTPRLNVRQKWCANTAESHSWGTSILSPNAVQKNAHINCKQVTDVKTISESYCEVYDLTIEGEHEYFANGVLVHNCIDAVRYYVLGELLGKIQKPKDLTGIFTH